MDMAKKPFGADAAKANPTNRCRRRAKLSNIVFIRLCSV
jgi:hypothetical protein